MRQLINSSERLHEMLKISFFNDLVEGLKEAYDHQIGFLDIHSERLQIRREESKEDIRYDLLLPEIGVTACVKEFNKKFKEEKSDI